LSLYSLVITAKPVEPLQAMIMVGPSSRDLPLVGRLQVE